MFKLDRLYTFVAIDCIRSNSKATRLSKTTWTTWIAIELNIQKIKSKIAQFIIYLFGLVVFRILLFQSYFFADRSDFFCQVFEVNRDSTILYRISHDLKHSLSRRFREYGGTVLLASTTCPRRMKSSLTPLGFSLEGKSKCLGCETYFGAFQCTKSALFWHKLSHSIFILRQRYLW
jgi:hypothetical protein